MVISKVIRSAVKRKLRRFAEIFGIYRWSSPALHGIDKRLAKYLPETPGFFIEAGAHNGYSQSNTYYWERVKHWQGILVEPIFEQYQECCRERPNSACFHNALVDFEYSQPTVPIYSLSLLSQMVDSTQTTAQSELRERGMQLEKGVSGEIEYAPARTLTSILEEVKPSQIDFFSLDVEGNELSVLKGLDWEKYSPRLILVEANKPDELEDFLCSRGYKTIRDFSPNDLLFIKESKAVDTPQSLDCRE
ncbi:MAG: FkbM family methyltransferase [Lentisphaerae bacterium]|nr:FkbM family methyltransferase [Lentisphaerota bacterium]